MPTHTIDQDLCTACGLCAEVCGAAIYAKTPDGVVVKEEQRALCMACGHCMAICPVNAVSVAALDASGFGDLPPDPAGIEPLEALMVRRRSARGFTDQPVPRDTLGRIISAATTAPMGFPPSEVEVTVLSARAQVAKIVPVAIQSCRQLAQAMHKPVVRPLMLGTMPRKLRILMENHLVPLLAPILEAYDERGIDAITWNAPAMLIWHTAPDAAAGETDCVIASTYAMLAAEALGLGTIMLGLAHHAIQRDKALRAELGIPADHDTHNCLALGFAGRKFLRSIPRQFRAVHWTGE